VIASSVLFEVVDRALLEDLQGGDLTTEATVAADAEAIGRAVAKAPLVVCGADVFRAVCKRVDPTLAIAFQCDEGVRAERGEVLWSVRGNARSILMGERTALNFVQRLSGIATLARRYVDAVPADCTARITDTRKTTPGLRALERYAVRTGGAHNHRDSLGSAVLIKDNHIEAAGSIFLAIQRAKAYAPHSSRIEIEVESSSALDEALDAGADVVMLDNFAPDQIADAVTRAKGRALVEVSGGITLERIPELATAGVDIISVGALTHSAPAADISLDIERV
jgi:nicotinate-nucleotide pyrophosphorylase (carboxylating)